MKTKQLSYTVNEDRIYFSKKLQCFYPTMVFDKDGHEEIGLQTRIKPNIMGYKLAGENNHFIIYDKKKSAK